MSPQHAVNFDYARKLEDTETRLRSEMRAEIAKLENKIIDDKIKLLKWIGTGLALAQPVLLLSAIKFFH